MIVVTYTNYLKKKTYVYVRVKKVKNGCNNEQPIKISMQLGTDI